MNSKLAAADVLAAKMPFAALVAVTTQVVSAVEFSDAPETKQPAVVVA